MKEEMTDMNKLKKMMLALAFVVMLPSIALAVGGNELAYFKVQQLVTLDALSLTSADYVPVYDASANEVKKVSATVFNQLASFEDVVAANTLTQAECGKTMTLNSTTEFASTLHAPLAGCSFKFIVKSAPSGASYTIVTNGGANVIIGGINELEVDTGDDGPYSAAADTITLVDGLASVGDYVEMFSDGTSWYITGQTRLDGGITLTAT
jgi:hypothetical protein